MTGEGIQDVTFDNGVKLFGLEDKLEHEEKSIHWRAFNKIKSEYPHYSFK